MSSTGFAIEKLYGSVWQFTPSDLDVERSIQFHEPHPSGKIPFRMARRYGRRLFRAYGRHAGMFKLAEWSPQKGAGLLFILVGKLIPTAVEDPRIPSAVHSTCSLHAINGPAPCFCLHTAA